MAEAPRRQLTLFDSTSLILGIIIGAGIFETAPAVAGSGGSAWGLMGLWVVGGLLSLCGALSYAELATAWPREGGDYVYLSRAYGRPAGFLFGWLQLVVVRPGDIALMAFVFARYALRALRPELDPDGDGRWMYLTLACLPVPVFTLINVAGVATGKWTQNVLTLVKVLGIVSILVIAVVITARGDPGPDIPASAGPPLPISVALIFVLFTYGGWNEMAFVAAEVRNPERNLVRALVCGVVGVTGLYLLTNAAFLTVLGYDGLTNSEAVAADTIRAAIPHAGRVISILICVSALGAINGLIFAGARITFVLGSEHPLFRGLGHWSSRTGTPTAALVAQGVVALTVIYVFGSFQRTILYTAGAVYTFYLATTLSVIVLRWREPGRPRPFRDPFYPVSTLFFAGTCGYLIYSAWQYDWRESAISFSIILLGGVVYLLQELAGRRDRQPS